MKIEVNQVALECRVGDIAAQSDIEAVVNAANAELMPGGGVAGALHARAGRELAKACAPLAPISPGEAVLTKGFNLPNAYVIHTLGPVYGRDEPSEELLAHCYRQSLKVAENQGIASVAFPAISTGAFGYPLVSGAEVACRTVVSMVPELSHVRLVRFVMFDERAHEVFSEKLQQVAE
ncbi:macro domain-containing protein [Fodinicurvata halophila]|uniref:Macro domain-containing protein n=1 Tax=Fodinicurvata halophila TaxID=1419723 RepID=A0ABV8UQX9_9PROT